MLSAFGCILVFLCVCVIILSRELDKQWRKTCQRLNEKPNLADFEKLREKYFNLSARQGNSPDSERKKTE
jgi:hypothetical protein